MSAPQPFPRATTIDAALSHVADALQKLRFGDIRLTVHEGRIVQIDVTEKIRLPQT